MVKVSKDGFVSFTDYLDATRAMSQRMVELEDEVARLKAENIRLDSDLVFVSETAEGLKIERDRLTERLASRFGEGE